MQETLASSSHEVVYLPPPWGGFAQVYGDRTRRLVSEASEAWASLRPIRDLLICAVDAASDAHFDSDPVAQLRGLIDISAQSLLLQPAIEAAKARPLMRFLAAIDYYDRSQEELIGLSPDFVRIPVRAALDLPGMSAPARFRLRRSIRNGGWLDVPVRRRISDYLSSQLPRRTKIEAALFSTLARVTMGLLIPWQIFRRHRLSIIGATKAPPIDLRASQASWVREIGRLSIEVDRALGAYREWEILSGEHIEPEVVAGPPLFRPRWPGRFIERRQAIAANWARQQRSIQSMLRLERDLITFSAELTRETVSALAALDAEYAESVRELESLLEWIDGAKRTPHLAASGLPQPQARLLSAVERTAEWTRNIRGSASRHLPVELECCSTEPPTFGWRKPFRRLQPVAAAEEIAGTRGKSLALPVFKQAEAVDSGIIREVERAREVIAFGMEAMQDRRDASLLDESLTNAYALLTHQRGAAPVPHHISTNGLARAQAAVMHEIYARLEQDRMGQLVYTTRRAGREVIEDWKERGTAWTRAAALAAEQRVQRWVERFLVRLGLALPPDRQLTPVVERPRLSAALDLRWPPSDLPALYERLFRLAPVDDERFLVGRRVELSALADAVARWKTGSPVSVLIVGERGSGKTSLLNCSKKAVFQQDAVVRSAFHDRLHGLEQVRQFAASLIGETAGTDPFKAFESCRRIIILEELERAYLRSPAGFEGIRHLLRLIEVTAPTTLWVVSVNLTAFNFLDRAVNLSQYFSHCIDAMAVSREDIESAILMRHNLSGLRLQFAPPPQTSRAASVIRAFGIKIGPQAQFFRSLYTQSRGNFRAAIELWRNSIDRIEAGIVQIRHPLSPHYLPLLSELTQTDVFAIQALMQHGGLTASELSEIFVISPEGGSRRLARLQGLELIEPEPSFPGFRISPQATRVAREALLSHNLL